jgi:asparagine synthetase B (glutamine-hydrolysing)
VTRSRRRWRASTTAVPDETGVVVVDRDVIFAHKRLAIIDVEFSHEPLPYRQQGRRPGGTC